MPPLDATLRLIRRAGYHVSVHRMFDYVELHGLLCTDPESSMHLVRIDGGDTDDHVMRAALALAEQLGVDVEGL